MPATQITKKIICGKSAGLKRWIQPGEKLIPLLVCYRLCLTGPVCSVW